MDITRLTVLLGFSTCKISLKIRKMSDIHVVDVCRLDHKLNLMFRDVKKLILTLQIVVWIPLMDISLFFITFEYDVRFLLNR